MIFKLFEENKFARKASLQLGIIILIGIVVRIYFNIGHIFSDDAYYSFLSYQIFNSDFPGDYLGYPIFPLRINHLIITALSFDLFGTNELSSLVFPYLISVANLLLTYKLAKLLTDDHHISLMATLLIAFFPTDVVFATINFVDSPNVFFINLGIYFLIKSHKINRNRIAFLGGMFLFTSMQFKENVFYVLILLIILLFYYLINHKQLNFQLAVGLIFIGANFFIEGFVYLILHNDFLYRFTTTQVNYQYSYYDFFPHTAQKFSGSSNNLKNLFDQIFLINGRAILLRRFYLLLPIIASIQSFINFKINKYTLLNFWFFGTLFLIIVFTTSFTDYKPLDLKRSWYIYPLLMPMIILSAIFISRFKSYIRYILVGVYIAGSLIMCDHYVEFFDMNNSNELKIFLRSNAEKTIYTDHFTKYSLDLIRGYHDLSKSKKILGENFNFHSIGDGEWILFNKKHIDELILQKYKYPDFGILNSKEFLQVADYNDFIFYERIIQSIAEQY
jgi:4-amino-4-deoxy-L-arabinose transferase-like glycosyltransferase